VGGLNTDIHLSPNEVERVLSASLGPNAPVWCEGRHEAIGVSDMGFRRYFRDAEGRPCIKFTEYLAGLLGVEGYGRDGLKVSDFDEAFDRFAKTAGVDRSSIVIAAEIEVPYSGGAMEITLSAERLMVSADRSDIYQASDEFAAAMDKWLGPAE
jgi:hypothetical protein